MRPLRRELPFRTKSKEKKKGTDPRDQARYEQWIRVQGESQRALIVVSGVIIGLMLAAALMNSTPNLIRCWAILPVGCFTATILHIVFVISPLTSKLIYHDEDTASEELSGVLRGLILIGTWRLWWAWQITSEAPKKYDTALYWRAFDPGAREIPIRVKKFRGKGRIKVYADALNPLYGLGRFWFILGILTSIGLVLTYIWGIGAESSAPVAPPLPPVLPQHPYHPG